MSTIALWVWDITRLSEIAIDDPFVSGVAAVPKPGSFALIAAGLTLTGARRENAKRIRV